MTIAVCYVSPEGVVFGADSTTTMNGPSGSHYFDHSQKVFEIGEDSTLGIVTWGLSGLLITSHRLQIAMLADSLREVPPLSVEEAAQRWVDAFWAEYDASDIVVEYRALAAKLPFDGNAMPPDPLARTKDEEDLLRTLNIGVGFCIGGHVLPDRLPAAYCVWFSPTDGKPDLVQISIGDARFFGAPSFILRQINGHDPGIRPAILSSGHWSGTEEELDELLGQFSLAHPGLMPVRDAIDFVHSSILSTIKALKFSNLSQICGGPVELAVITSDRRFRWVRHKPWDSAVIEGET